MDILKRIEQFIFYLAIFAIPFGTRVIIKQWNETFIEWNSAFLYGTDVLIGIILSLWLLRLAIDGRPKIIFRKSDFFLISFIIVSAFSLFEADVFPLGFYRLVKLFEFVGFYWYIRANINEIFQTKILLFVFVVSAFFQSILSIGQYVIQSNLGWGLKYLGETILAPGAAGVATISVKGEKFLRSYGTTPHPNILAFILFNGIFAYYLLYFNQGEKFLKFEYFLLYASLILGLFFTFSRMAVALWLITATISLFIVFLKPKFWIIFLRNFFKFSRVAMLTFAIIAAFSILFYPQIFSRIFNEGNSVYLRFWYLNEGISAIKSNLFWGVGIGNFVNYFMTKEPNLISWQYQPVHNIFIQIGAETGIVGLGFFILFLTFLAREYMKATNLRKFRHILFFLMFLSFLAAGLIDHFLLTIQQGALLFWLFMGVFAALSRIKKSSSGAAIHLSSF